jgi:hypothetical protein
MKNYSRSSMVADDPFGFACGATCVKIVQMIFGIDNGRADVFPSSLDLFKVKFVCRVSVFGQKFSLKNDLIQIFSLAIF